MKYKAFFKNFKHNFFGSKKNDNPNQLIIVEKSQKD